jgi:hypothetical protein
MKVIGKQGENIRYMQFIVQCKVSSASQCFTDSASSQMRYVFVEGTQEQYLKCVQIVKELI